MEGPGPAHDIAAPAVRLRPVQPADLAALFAHQADADAAAQAAVPSRGEADFHAHWARLLRDPGIVARAVEWEGRLAGNVVSWPAGGRRLVGYWIGREFWGRGIATAALRGLVLEVRHRPLHAHVARANLPSLRVLAKAGFRPVEGEGDAVEQVFVLR